MTAPLSFLFDECLTPSLVGAAEQAGHYGSHARDLGLIGASDPKIAKAALATDRAVVTNNRRDHVRIYAELDIHPGLVILIPVNERLEQIASFEAVLAFVADLPELINKLVEIDAAGRITCLDLPQP